MDTPPPPIAEPAALNAEDIVRTRAERPLRMAAVTPATGFEPLVGHAPLPSAVPSYAAPISFDWRRDEVLAGAGKEE
jgi:hypothetical protein